MTLPLVPSARPGALLAGSLTVWTFATVLACGGTGSTTGERTPGGSTRVDPTPDYAYRDDAGALYVQGRGDAAIPVFTDAGTFNIAAARLGRIAVDERDETAFVMQTFPTRAAVKEFDGGLTIDTLGQRTLYAVRDGAEATALLDLDGFRSTAVFFPESGVLLAASRSVDDGNSCATTLALWNVGATVLRQLRPATGCVSVGALSPSRRWATARSDSRFGLLDASTLVVGAVPAIGADNVSAAWLHRRDALVSVAASDVARASLRVDLWNLSSVTSEQISSPAVPVAREGGATFTIDPVTQVSPSILQVSPDDQLAVLSSYDGPIFTLDGSRPTTAVHVVELATRAHWSVDVALGPVGFTPDNSTLVAWRHTSPATLAIADAGSFPSDAALLFIDRVTHAVTARPLPFEGPPLFFVTSTGHRVLVSGTAGAEIFFYDMEMGRFTALSRDAAPLDNFVRRNGSRELWAARGGLWRYGVLTDDVEHIDLGWQPEQINLLPRSDLLVLDRPYENALSFWSPATRATVRTVRLPVPARR
ncbi:MAG: hypothetical protein JWM10_4618 [Myxococcaceae bacterium]|nr:hypothetical protein [Myxococcaceae bacterium]